MSSLVILGCGYVGSRIARTALAEGRSVRVCSRSTGRLQPLGELGAEVKFVDASTPKSFTSVLASAHGATVVYSIPPITALPPGHAMRAALQAAYGGGAGCFVYFSSCGLYGDSPDDDTWVDENTPLAADAAMQNVLSDEREIATSSLGLRTVAEGVESAEQVQLLTALGCDVAQGFHFARPMSAEAALTVLLPQQS